MPGFPLLRVEGNVGRSFPRAGEAPGWSNGAPAARFNLREGPDTGLRSSFLDMAIFVRILGAPIRESGSLSSCSYLALGS